MFGKGGFGKEEASFDFDGKAKVGTFDFSSMHTGATLPHGFVPTPPPAPTAASASTTSVVAGESKAGAVAISAVTGPAGSGHTPPVPGAAVVSNDRTRRGAVIATAPGLAKVVAVSPGATSKDVQPVKIPAKKQPPTPSVTSFSGGVTLTKPIVQKFAHPNANASAHAAPASSKPTGEEKTAKPKPSALQLKRDSGSERRGSDSGSGKRGSGSATGSGEIVNGRLVRGRAVTHAPASSPKNGIAVSPRGASHSDAISPRYPTLKGKLYNLNQRVLNYESVGKGVYNAFVFEGKQLPDNTLFDDIMKLADLQKQGVLEYAIKNYPNLAPFVKLEGCPLDKTLVAVRKLHEVGESAFHQHENGDTVLISVLKQLRTERITTKREVEEKTAYIRLEDNRANRAYSVERTAATLKSSSAAEAAALSPLLAKRYERATNIAARTDAHAKKIKRTSIVISQIFQEATEKFTEVENKFREIITALLEEEGIEETINTGKGTENHALAVLLSTPGLNADLVKRITMSLVTEGADPDFTIPGESGVSKPLSRIASKNNYEDAGNFIASYIATLKTGKTKDEAFVTASKAAARLHSDKDAGQGRAGR